MAAPSRPAIATPSRRAAAIPGQTFSLRSLPLLRPVPAPRRLPARRPLPLLSAGARAEITGRAVIGDQLRMPIMWCEIGSCISWHADPAALGEADTRARAISAGWRIDALGRLACPRCQQTDPGFRATDPVVQWDRYTAIARAARATAAAGASAPPGEAAVTPAALPAAIPLPCRRSRDGTSQHLYFRSDGHEGDPRLASFPQQPDGIRHARETVEACRSRNVHVPVLPVQRD